MNMRKQQSRSSTEIVRCTNRMYDVITERANRWGYTTSSLVTWLLEDALDSEEAIEAACDLLDGRQFTFGTPQKRVRVLPDTYRQIADLANDHPVRPVAVNQMVNALLHVALSVAPAERPKLVALP